MADEPGPETIPNNDWATPALRHEGAALARDPETGEAGDYTLHHKLAKDRLAVLAAQAAAGRDTPAVQAFVETVNALTHDGQRRRRPTGEAGELRAQLDNMPMNLEHGPASGDRSEDPGRGFDANTERWVRQRDPLGRPPIPNLMLGGRAQSAVAAASSAMGSPASSDSAMADQAAMEDSGPAVVEIPGVTRRLTPRSFHLMRVHDLLVRKDAAMERLREKGQPADHRSEAQQQANRLSDEDWGTVTDAFQQAQRHHRPPDGHALTPPIREQWQTGSDGKFERKGRVLEARQKYLGDAATLLLKQNPTEDELEGVLRETVMADAEKDFVRERWRRKAAAQAAQPPQARPVAAQKPKPKGGRTPLDVILENQFGRPRAGGPPPGTAASSSSASPADVPAKDKEEDA